MRRGKVSFIFAVIGALAMVQAAHADDGGQVFYRYGWNFLKSSRANQVFTDTNTGGNNGTGGWNIGAGLDVPLAKSFGPGDLLGEIMLDYAHYSAQTVTQTTSALLGKPAASNVTVSELEVVVAPKYRFMELLDGKVRPWIIPAGLAFLVNSPPSNDSSYLDIGYQLGAGVEYVVIPKISIGGDFRYTFAANEPNVSMTGGQVDLYLGINF